MLKINIISVGKLSENYLLDAQNEYTKRLSVFCKLNIKEVPESRLDSSPSQLSIDKCLLAEGDKILSLIPQKAFIIALCVEGKQLSSEDFASTIENCAINNFSDIFFIIGSSYGLHEKIKQKANMRMSMSKMTFPHMLARVFLLEQIYRSFKILGGGTYHK